MYNLMQLDLNLRALLEEAWALLIARLIVSWSVLTSLHAACVPVMLLHAMFVDVLTK